MLSLYGVNDTSEYHICVCVCARVCHDAYSNVYLSTVTWTTLPSTTCACACACVCVCVRYDAYEKMYLSMAWTKFPSISVCVCMFVRGVYTYLYAYRECRSFACVRMVCIRDTYMRIRNYFDITIDVDIVVCACVHTCRYAYTHVHILGYRCR